jgi:hypothetical protein
MGELRGPTPIVSLGRVLDHRRHSERGAQPFGHQRSTGFESTLTA